MAGIPKGHNGLYFDALCRTQKKETIYSLIKATYYAKKRGLSADETKIDIAKKLQYAYGLYKDNIRGYDNGYGSYQGTVDQFSSQYTIGHEMAIWKNSDLDLNNLAVKVAEDKITVVEYFDIVFLNYFQPIQNKAVHLLYSILVYMKNNSLKEFEKNMTAEALGVPCEDGAINGLFNMLGDTSYFTLNGNKLYLNDEYNIDQLISKCNIEYIGEDGLSKAYVELDNNEKYARYISTNRNVITATTGSETIYINDYSEEELGKILRDYYESEETDKVTGIYLFGIQYGHLIKEKNYNKKNIIRESGISESYYIELNKALNICEHAKVLDEEPEYIIKDKVESIEVFDEYTKKDFLDEVFISEEKYNSLVSLLEKKKNIILEGAPGVGKTFMAKRLAYSILGRKDKNKVKLIQFHQSYSYEDFIEGYRPTEDGFELQKGIFYKLCKKAQKDSNNNYYIIIDEINRGNLSKIFGELLMLIESDKRGESLTLAYSEESFTVPENLYIIGLMNTADRSLALIDYALRRRFSFIRIEPAFDSDKFRTTFESKFDSDYEYVINIIKKINEAIENDKSLGSGFKIGHSYFCPNLKDRKGNKKDIEDIIIYEIIPLLEEYWYDDEDSLITWKDALNGVIND